MQMGKLKENSYVVGYKKMKINDEITYDVKNYCIIYNFDESGIIKSYTISKPTENEKDRIYEFFNGFHDWFLKQINFDNDSKALCIEIISDDRSQTICELRCEGVTNMMLPVESPWNTRTLYINMAFIEGDSLGIELLTGDMWKIKASRYVFKTTTLSEREAVAMPKYYPGEKIPNANGEG